MAGAAVPAQPEQNELETWLLGYQHGDASAAASLVRAVSPILFRYCLSQGEAVQHAEDIVQETWLRVHKARHTYRPGAPAIPWLFSIARHTRVDLYRRRRRVTTREVALDGVPEPAARSRSAFLSVLESLPDGERETLTMLKGMGMTIDEVARATATTAGAVKQRAHRAYVRLRALLAVESGEGAS